VHKIEFGVSIWIFDPATLQSHIYIAEIRGCSPIGPSACTAVHEAVEIV
jgi:hypothetical protein